MSIDFICVTDLRADPQYIRQLSERFSAETVRELPTDTTGRSYLLLSNDGLRLIKENKVLFGDFRRMLPRVSGGHIQHELLLKAAKLSSFSGSIRVLDATAGMGEDSFILAAAGCSVELCEHNSITAALLQDALLRAVKDPQLRGIAARMRLLTLDSKQYLRTISYRPEIIYLDPMYPTKKKSAESKAKLQALHLIEAPCEDEKDLVAVALAAKPRKIIIKRPPGGRFLADMTPSYSIERKAVRFDCLVP